MSALFFDVDGTLVDWQAGVTDVPDEAVREMRRIRAAGNRLFISSGRPLPFIGAQFRDLGCFDGYVLLNGGLVELEGEIVFERRLEEGLAEAVADLHEEVGAGYAIDTARAVCIDPTFDDALDFLSGHREAITCDFDRATELERAIKIESCPTAEQRAYIADRLERDLGGSLSFDDNGTGNTFEAYSSRLSKASGIRHVLERIGVDAGDTYAFGDGINDLEMIRACGCGVAMGNAVRALKEASDVVCDPVGEGGLAKVLRELFA